MGVGREIFTNIAKQKQIIHTIDILMHNLVWIRDVTTKDGGDTQDSCDYSPESFKSEPATIVTSTTQFIDWQPQATKSLHVLSSPRTVDWRHLPVLSDIQPSPDIIHLTPCRVNLVPELLFSHPSYTYTLDYFLKKKVGSTPLRD